MKIQEPKNIPHVACPSCGKLERINYTTKGKTYIWWCENDDCGKQYKWMQRKDSMIEAEPTGVVVKPLLVLLRLEPQESSLYLIVKGGKHSDDDSPEANLKYFYNEGTCPVNYFNASENVYLGKDNEDPHGLFEYVSSVPKIEDVSLNDFSI